MASTAELLRMYTGPIHVDRDVTEDRRHDVKPNRVTLLMWCDVIDVTPDPAPEDRCRRKAVGDRHAAVTVPVPLWCVDGWYALRRIIG